MSDYKELYLKMLRASEKALNLLIEAQRECEELYISCPPPEFAPVEILKLNDKGTEKK
jgi:hypothetical protein